jgi:circadian clock protein KaiC
VEAVVLVSGTAGTGKSTIAAAFASAACARGESCLYFAFEESPRPDRPQHALGRH